PRRCAIGIGRAARVDHCIACATIFWSALREGSTLVEQAVRKKRTIGEIRESKKTGEKMVYTSVPDYTSARWAEMAGVDVAVAGDPGRRLLHARVRGGTRRDCQGHLAAARHSDDRHWCGRRMRRTDSVEL